MEPSSIFPKHSSKPTVKSKYEKSNKKSYINSLSAIPMFDMNKYSGRDFYKTSYSQQYPEKSRRFSSGNPTHLTSQSLNFNTDGDSLSYADQYRLKKINGELISAHAGFSNKNYKRPIIPPHIRRDDCFQSNSERNVSFLHTVYGILLYCLIELFALSKHVSNEGIIPYVPSEVKPSILNFIVFLRQVYILLPYIRNLFVKLNNVWWLGKTILSV